MPHADAITGLILAGGTSSRFGADKAFVEVRGRPMVVQVASVVSAVCGEVLVSAGADSDRRFEAIGRCVVDRYTDAGPLAGLHAGLLAAGSEWVLAVACDMPAVTHEALRLLTSACDAPADVVVATDASGRHHPLCACYRTDLLTVVEAQLDAGAYAMHALLSRAKDRVVEVCLPDGVLRNVNTRDDLCG